MRWKTFLFGLAIVFSTVVSAVAQGTVVPRICEIRPCPPPPRPLPPLPNFLPIKSIKIETQINGQVATTHVEQVFLNETPYTLEGIYFFPIPDSAAVEEFAIWENGKRLTSEVRSRDEARRIYNEIVRRQRDPGLLEYAGKNLLQASIFPIPPHSEKKIELRFSEVLKAESGTVSYRYPIGLGQRAWLQGVTGNQRAPRTFSGVVRIRSNQPIRNIYSPTHRIDVKKQGESEATVTFEASGDASAGTDFRLFYTSSREDLGLTLLTYREPAKDGFFLLLVSPKDEIQEKEISDKDIVFVIDTSGSMATDRKIDQAKSALLFGIGGLKPTDRFNIISFAGEERLMSAELLRATPEAKKKAEDFVKNLQATGGTNINDALIAAKRQFDVSSDRPKILVFLTDGQPTVGETSAEKIIKNFADSRNVSGLRMFVFGVGYDVNTILLDKLASENSGLADYIEPDENLEVRVSSFFDKVNYPVLTDITIDFGDVQTEMIYPRRLPDLFRGSQISLIGRYKTFNNNASIVLRGRAAGRERTFRYNGLEFPQVTEANSFLPRLWAIRRVGWLTEQIRLNGEQKELKDEIIELGTRYGIVTPYTSAIALEAGVGDRERAQAFRMAPTTKADVGMGAVVQSKQAQAQQQAVNLSAESKQMLSFSSNYAKQVENKIFYNVQDERGRTIWQDAEFDAKRNLPEVRLKFGSDEFFNILASEPALAQYFALGEHVVVVWKGKVYRVETDANK